jgi:hypothetical protein
MGRDLRRITTLQILGVSPWVIMPVFVAGWIALFRWFEKKGW